MKYILEIINMDFYLIQPGGELIMELDNIY